jgi:hypothetical protein
MSQAQSNVLSRARCCERPVTALYQCERSSHDVSLLHLEERTSATDHGRRRSPAFSVDGMQVLDSGPGMGAATTLAKANAFGLLAGGNGSRNATAGADSAGR